MDLYVIRRRSAFEDAEDLKAKGARSAQVGNEEMPDRVRWIRSYVVRERSAQVGNEEMPDRVRWIRSYVVREPDGKLGTVCIYQAVDEAAIREHAERAGLAVSEISPVQDTIIVRDDPTTQAAA